MAWMPSSRRAIKRFVAIIKAVWMTFEVLQAARAAYLAVRLLAA